MFISNFRREKSQQLQGFVILNQIRKARSNHVIENKFSIDQGWHLFQRTVSVSVVARRFFCHLQVINLFLDELHVLFRSVVIEFLVCLLVEHILYPSFQLLQAF